MIATEKRTFTVADYLQLPEGAPYQLVNGKLIMSPSPSFKHQQILTNLIIEIGIFLRKNPAAILIAAPFDIFISNENVLQPDLSVVLNENRSRIDEDGGLHGAPDIAIEILSPSNSYYDTNVKMKIYEAAGIREYFIVDPSDQLVMAYYLKNKKLHEQYREAGIVRSDLLKFECRF